VGTAIQAVPTPSYVVRKPDSYDPDFALPEGLVKRVCRTSLFILCPYPCSHGHGVSVLAADQSRVECGPDHAGEPHSFAVL
jgi:hypothetical protein